MASQSSSLSYNVHMCTQRKDQLEISFTFQSCTLISTTFYLVIVTYFKKKSNKPRYDNEGVFPPLFFLWPRTHLSFFFLSIWTCSSKAVFLYKRWSIKIIRSKNSNHMLCHLMWTVKWKITLRKFSFINCYISLTNGHQNERTWESASILQYMRWTHW
jgi:hypothetical protein